METIRIIVVDDHAILRDGLTAMLGSERGFAVVGEAPDGRAAVNLAAALEADVIVMDVALPVLNGIEATRKIVAMNHDARVIVLSSYSDRRTVSAAFDAGAWGFVAKIAVAEELVRAILSVHSGRRYVSPDVTGAVIDSLLHPADESAPIVGLGGREREVLQLIAEGRTSPQIAQELNISPGTVETHRRNIMRKLDLHSVAELTKFAVREGITSL